MPDLTHPLFYYEGEKANFNIDVFAYAKPVENWPYEEIEAVLIEMNVTGEVLPFRGENYGFVVDTQYYPPAIIVSVKNGEQTRLASEYNQMLLDNGYHIAGYIYGDPAYSFDKDTLAYRAVYLQGNTVTIELFNVSELN